MSDLENKGQQFGGKIKEGVGEATDDKDLAAEGRGDQAEGKVREGLDKAKDAAGDAAKSVKDAFGRIGKK
ncbi:CsbD family protein [Propionibacterium sp.]|uniref:CsbD family protein n=1 Tax=Propionibacterium sp. TaxID=1977903 RepID=UPI0039EA8B8A